MSHPMPEQHLPGPLRELAQDQPPSGVGQPPEKLSVPIHPSTIGKCPLANTCNGVAGAHLE